MSAEKDVQNRGAGNISSFMVRKIHENDKNLAKQLHAINVRIRSLHFQ
jgi:hypothetical protein